MYWRAAQCFEVLHAPGRALGLNQALEREAWQYDVTRDGRFLINTMVDDAATSSDTGL